MFFTRARSASNRIITLIDHIKNHFSKVNKTKVCSNSPLAKCKPIALFIKIVHFKLPLGICPVHVGVLQQQHPVLGEMEQPLDSSQPAMAASVFHTTVPGDKVVE